MSIWKKEITLDDLNKSSKNSMLEHLGIKLIEIGDDFLIGEMPVDHRTHQPMGLLHGGASVVLAESLGSIAGNLSCEEGFFCVGLEINANHLSQVKSGVVKGIAKPIHLGRKTQVWEIRVYREDNKLSCISRITLSVLKN